MLQQRHCRRCLVGVLNWRTLSPSKYFLTAYYTHGSKKKDKSNEPLMLSVHMDEVVGKQLLGSGGALSRKRKLKVSPNSKFNMNLIQRKLEHHFPGLSHVRYKVRYKIGDKMKIPARCATDEDAFEALQSCAKLKKPLYLSVHPDYTSIATEEGDGVGEIPPYLRDMPNPDRTLSFTMVSFYRFLPIPDPESAISQLRALWKPFKVYGRVYIAEEGINAQMAVPTNVLRHFEAACSSLDILRDRMNDLDFKVNCDSRRISTDEYYANSPFRALHIRKRKQILVDGLQQPLDWQDVKDELDPLEWHNRIPSNSLGDVDSSSTPIILDCRNKYESDVGRFDGAIPLNTNTFQDSWQALQYILKDKDASTPIMTYCTGGIRCVKINAFLRQKMGFKNTSRLKGGIIAYDKQRKEWVKKFAKNENEIDGDLIASKFKGVNYVFDERMGERITGDILTKCQSCGTPYDMYSNCKNCSIRFLQCKSCAFEYSSCCSETCQDKYLSRQSVEGLPRSRKSKQPEKEKISTQQKTRSFSTIARNASLQLVIRNSASVLKRRSKSDISEPKGSTLDLYCAMHSDQEPWLLQKLREETLRHCAKVSHRMLCDHLQGRLLSLLSNVHRPHKVLELGTFTGYSALCLAEGLHTGMGHSSPLLITVDSDPVTSRIARKFISKYLQDRKCPKMTGKIDDICIDLVEGLGADVLRSLRDETDHTFDLVFLDANKKGYIDYLQVLMGEGENGDRIMLSHDAIIIVDNTLWKGMVTEEVASLQSISTAEDGCTKEEKRMRKLSQAIHRFNVFCSCHPNLKTLMLPLRDGLTILRFSPAGLSL